MSNDFRMMPRESIIKAILYGAAAIAIVLILFFVTPVKKPIAGPIQGDTKAPLNGDMIENHLHVERFGPVHKTVTRADGTTTQEEYWEAFISDDRNHHVYSVKCTPECEAKWREFEKWAKGRWIMEIKDNGP